MLGEDQAWLEHIAIGMMPEDGGLDVWDTDDDIAITAFTHDGVENLKHLLETRAAPNGRLCAPPERPASPAPWRARHFFGSSGKLQSGTDGKADAHYT